MYCCSGPVPRMCVSATCCGATWPCRSEPYKSHLNAQNMASTKIRCYYYVQAAGATVLLQLRCYWAELQPAAASMVPNKCHVGDGHQKYAGHPNEVQSMLMINIQALLDEVMLTMTGYLCMRHDNLNS